MADEADSSAGATLRRHSLRPRKSLGQNFLRDRSYLAKIVNAAELQPCDEVLEIGPGTGVLTATLAEQAAQVVAVELDDHLVQLLRVELSERQNLQVVHGDALEIDPRDYFSGAYKLIGNIPYYITGPILRRYLEMDARPEVLVLMVQKEVANRITAGPGDLSLLGVSVQFYADAKTVARVPRRAFVPAPKVDSAVIKITPREPSLPTELRDDFFSLARAGFGTKRKTLGNALSIGLSIDRSDSRTLLLEAGIDEQRRAQTLTLDEWTQLTQHYAARKS
jgi:16S rRNA (adenine1518-N6/adenine1519-N6)-dimethyltransferase